ncbi:hypothetical protein CI102_5457 [Trichoderma harzianum]|nr:hypothetical protein CI102_5457 [Trichoderma harzianum]
MLVFANSNGYYAAVNCPPRHPSTDQLTVTRHSTPPANDPDTKEIAGKSTPNTSVKYTCFIAHRYGYECGFLSGSQNRDKR